MKYAGMPFLMWALFKNSLGKNLTIVFGLDKSQAKSVMKNAKAKYKEIIAKLPEFEKGDRFKMNIVNCAVGCAVVLCMPKRPTVEELTVYYRDSMMTGTMKWFCHMSGKRKFTKKDIDGMKKNSRFPCRRPQPLFVEYGLFALPDGNGYEGRFTKCGICVLTKELGLFDLTPAMCALDHTMSEAGGATKFVRQYTIANGDAYCDCGYKKR